MVTFVVIHNFIFGLACLLIARKVWHFKRKLGNIADSILSVEQAVHRVLYPAPGAMQKAQVSTNRLREHYARLGVQYDRLQQMMSILTLSQFFWRYRRFATPFSRSKAGSTKLEKRRNQ